MSQIIIAVVVTAVIVAFVSWNLAIAHRKKTYESKIGSAEVKSREIIEEALKTAETKKREALLEAKEESLRTKNELERETKERRAELQRYENRVLNKEENLDRKQVSIEKKESALAVREEKINERSQEVDSLYDKGIAELERISGLSTEQAKEFLLQSVEEDVKHDTAKLIKDLETAAKEEADKKAKEFVVGAIQRCAADSVAESTVSVVQLPNDEMKGRIIGREGRNIRALEQLTGVELIVDDTPEAVVLSGFDPVRREVAKVALEKLITDGRIHPARIEEMVEKAQREVENTMREAGEAAVLEVGVNGIHPELVKLLGRMKFRTSYGQNALKHSIEVAELSGHLAAEVGVDVRMAKRAGLLHDIGKAVDHEIEGSHVQLGVELCRKYRESALVINTVESHHGDVEPESLIACIVQAADTISAARPGARRETDPDPSRGARIAVCRVRRALHLTGQNMAYLALMPVQRIVNIQNRISRITEHGINALLLQTFHYNLGAIQFCHRFVSLPASLRPFLRKQRLTNIINQCPSFFNLPAAKESAFPAQMYLCKKKTSTFTTAPPSLTCESALLIKAEKILGKQQWELKSLSSPLSSILLQHTIYAQMIAVLCRRVFPHHAALRIQIVPLVSVQIPARAHPAVFIKEIPLAVDQPPCAPHTALIRQPEPPATVLLYPLSRTLQLRVPLLLLPCLRLCDTDLIRIGPVPLDGGILRIDCAYLKVIARPARHKLAAVIAGPVDDLVGSERRTVPHKLQLIAPRADRLRPAAASAFHDSLLHRADLSLKRGQRHPNHQRIRAVLTACALVAGAIQADLARLGDAEVIAVRSREVYIQLRSVLYGPAKACILHLIVVKGVFIARGMYLELLLSKLLLYLNQSRDCQRN